jgi:ribosomal protein L11 methyltransferase
MQVLVVTTDVQRSELAADALWALGVLAVEERTTADGHVELRTSLGDDITLPAAFAWPWRVEELDDAVVDGWREFAAPVVVEQGLVISPAWIDTAQPAGVTVLRIEPGTTFGLGDHPTTQLCLRALRHEVRAGDAVLDVGSGSGVLAIAASRFGAARVAATDIAAAAVTIGAANAAANGVAGIEFSNSAPGDIAGPFHIVVANILAPVLIELAGQLVAQTTRTLILSGLMSGRVDHVVEAMHPLQLVRTDEQNGWVALTLNR